jgi:hypothetical protein
MHHRRWLGAVMAAGVLSLLPTPASAGSPSTPEEAARLESGWEQAREQQARTIRANARRIAEILAKEGGTSTDEHQRAQRVTQERVAGEWAEDRKKLQDATMALDKNVQLANAHLTRATEAALAAAGRVHASGVLEKAARIEAAAGELRELLTARAERERAALEREREQRQRETGERARGQRW